MKRFIWGICVMLMTMTATAQTDKFCIAKDGKAATIVVDNNDWKGVLRAANNLGDDVRKVSGTAAAVVESAAAPQQLAPSSQEPSEKVALSTAS